MSAGKGNNDRGEGKRTVHSHPKPELKLKASHEEQVNMIRGDKDYQKRREAHLEGAPLPGEGFPEAIYTDNWFREREHDLTSDEEVGKMRGDEDEGEKDEDDEGEGDLDGDD